MEIIIRDSGIIVDGFGQINLPLTLDCGQAFRWRCCEDGLWRSVCRDSAVSIGKRGTALVFYGVSSEQVRELWLDYFDLFRDYESILERFRRDSFLKPAVEKNGCIRILNQQPWEALCSFIISACNNIPRIKLIISRLCEAFGEKIGEEYKFPSAERLAGLKTEDLAVLKCGFRDKYILDAAVKCASGEVGLEKLRFMDENTARNELMKINGVGRKVADCTLLFSLGFFDVMPVDVHVRRALEAVFPEGLPECTDGAAGLAQQYIFLSDLKKA